MNALQTSALAAPASAPQTIDGLSWGYRFTEAGDAELLQGPALRDALERQESWLWLNFDLHDPRAAAAIADLPHLPPEAVERLLTKDDRQPIECFGQVIGGVVADCEARRAGADRGCEAVSSSPDLGYEPAAASITPRKSFAMNAPARPFDDIRALLAAMPKPDAAAVAAVRAREAQLTKPAGSLGRLEEITEWLAAWQGARPHVDTPLVAVFAGNHGVVAQGVSPFPASVTQAMVANFSAGGAAINQICKTFDISLRVFELALEQPTGDITQEPALDEKGCAATMAFGMEALAAQPDLLCLGEMGIGNTTVAAAIYHALFGGAPEDWVGRGTGVDDAGLQRKAAAVRAAVARHRDHLGDPLEVLRRLGGREIAAMAGAILAARLQRVPVVLDGFVVCSAAAVLHALDPSALDHCVAGHVSAENAHAEALRRLGKAPLLNLGMRLGEGTGAALAVGILRAAVACHNGMATFAEAGVAGKED